MFAAASAAFAACSIVTPFDDLSKDFLADGGRPDGAVAVTDDGAVIDSAILDAAVDAPGSERACRTIRPQEGTYTYASRLGTFVGGDSLTYNGVVIPTQVWDNPFPATIRHSASDAGAPCFTFTAFYGKGDAGSHEHSWTFCNRCVGDAGALDIVGEVDTLKIGTIAQSTRYVCKTPNAFFQDGVPRDASLPQETCEGTTTGETPGQADFTVTVAPVSNVAGGRDAQVYANGSDASFPVETFTFNQSVAINGAVKSTPAIQVWAFNPETGLPSLGVGVRTLNLTVNALPVSFTWFNVFGLYAPNIAPLPP